MSQDSIGLITNGVNLIGLELDINKQLEDVTPRTTEIQRESIRKNYLNDNHNLLDPMT